MEGPQMQEMCQRFVLSTTQGTFIVRVDHDNPDPYPEFRNPTTSTQWLLSSMISYLTACFSLCSTSSMTSVQAFYFSFYISLGKEIQSNTCPVPFQKSINHPEEIIWNPWTVQPIYAMVPYDTLHYTYPVKSHRTYSPDCCVVTPGTGSDPNLLQISCQSCSNNYFQDFVVRLEASTPTGVFVNQTFMDGNTSKQFKKKSSEIYVFGTSKMINIMATQFVQFCNLQSVQLIRLAADSVIMSKHSKAGDKRARTS